MEALLSKPLPRVPRLQTLQRSLRFVKNPIPYLNAHVKEYGNTFTFYLGGIMKSIVTVDPAVVQHVLQKNHRNYWKSSLQKKHLGYYVGNGLLTSDGPYWLQQRRLIQPGFHKERLSNLVELMQQTIEAYLQELDAKIEKGEVVDLSKEMMQLAFRIVAHSLFSMGVSEAQLHRLDEIITHLQNFIIRSVRQPYLNPWFYLSGALKFHKRLSVEAKEIILSFIRERKNSKTGYDDLLQMLLDARYEGTGKGMTDQQLLEESMILFLAGHETSANALSWIFYSLHNHPIYLQKLEKERETVIGERKPAFQDLPKLTLLLQIIQESMRLYPPVWITDRVALEDDHINGYDIPKGSLIFPYIYGMHHHEEFWGEPSIFQPERFEKNLKKSQVPFSYLPFGGGPRLCIGNSFALMEMQLVLTAFLKRYRFSIEPGQEIWAKPMITLRPANGIKVKFMHL